MDCLSWIGWANADRKLLLQRFAQDDVKEYLRHIWMATLAFETLAFDGWKIKMIGART